MNKNLFWFSRWGAGVLAISILFGPSALAATTATTEIAASSLKTGDTLLGDLSAPTIEAQIAADKEAYNKLVDKLVADLSADQVEAIKHLLDQQLITDDTSSSDVVDPIQSIKQWLEQSAPPIVPDVISELQNYITGLSNNSVTNVTDTTDATNVGTTTPQGSFWHRLGHFFSYLFNQVKSYFVSPSQAANCREPGSESGACQQATSLAAAIEKAKSDQQEAKGKLKQALADWNTSNRQAYENLPSDKWTTKCLEIYPDPKNPKKQVCYKINNSTGTKVLADGSMYSSSGKNLQNRLVGVRSALQKNQVQAPGTTLLDKDQRQISAARDYINAMGPTLENTVLQKLASIACQLGVMTDGVLKVKNGKVYFSANPADNLCTYPLGSDTGQELLRKLREWGKKTSAYMKNVSASLEKNAQRQPAKQSQNTTSDLLDELAPSTTQSF